MTDDQLNALFVQGFEAHDANDFERAMKLFLQGASQRDDAAMSWVGLLHSYGEGVPQDKYEALKWFKRAFRVKTHRVGATPDHCSNIALTYAQLGNRQRAIHWWRKAVSLGDGDSAVHLAKFLMGSKEVVQLLQMAANCRESFEITGYGKEQAEYLLEILKKPDCD